MHNPKQIVIIAGEASGDLHAANLVRQLQQDFPNAYEFAAIGGPHLAAAGAFLIHDLAQFGVTGFTEVIRHGYQIYTAFQKVKNHLRQHRPALLILVDYPGFNLKLAKFAKRELNLPILYYISPQLWAWKAKRITLIRQCVDHMAVIFPFEKPIYEQANVACTFVGHPLLTALPQTTTAEARESLSLPPDRRLIALLPGSRQHEIKTLFPLMIKAAHELTKRFSHLHFIVPVAHTIEMNWLSALILPKNLPITLIPGNTPLALLACEMAIVASGTASLECALLAKPMCIIYKTSFISYLLALRLIKVKYLGLCNLIAQRMIVPELLQADCTVKNMVEIIADYLQHPEKRNKVKTDLLKMKERLMQVEAEKALPDIVHQLCSTL